MGRSILQERPGGCCAHNAVLLHPLVTCGESTSEGEFLKVSLSAGFVAADDGTILVLVEAASFQQLGGRVVGRAAALCCRLQCDLRAIYDKHLGKLKALLTNPDVLSMPARSGVDAP